MSDKAPLLEHQKIGAEFLREGGRAVLADEAGLGKTRTALEAAEGRTLAIVPAALLDTVWAREVQRWRPDLDIQLTSYSSLCARTADDRGHFTKPQPKPRLELKGPWDTVICDEAHYLKGRKTKWTLATEKVRTDRLFMLTGTPMPNWGHEIYMFLRLMHPGDRRFSSYWRWVQNWFLLGYNHHSGRDTEVLGLLPRTTWDDLAAECGLLGKWLRRNEDEVDLPPLRIERVEVPMTDSQRRLYTKLKKELFAVVEQTGNEIISWSPGGVWTKLYKLCTGISVEDPEAPWRGTSGKLQWIVDMVAERTSPTVLGCVYRSSAEQVARAIRETSGHSVGVIHGGYSRKDRNETANAFTDGELDVLVGTMGTISEGFTFTRADTAIVVERDPRPMRNYQFRKRIHRISQTKPCLVYDLVSPGTYDSAICELLADKEDDQELAIRAFDALQLV
jgi:SNF2 family DNA or RNA helicase